MNKFYILLAVLIAALFSAIPMISQASTDMSTSLKRLNPPEVIRGNTNANLINNGWCTKQEKWIYYSNLSDDGKLYKINNDCTENIKLSDDKWTWYLNVTGNWIFYSSGGKLTKLKTDGSVKKILDSQANYVNVLGDWIYYTRGPVQTGYPFKTKTDGTEKKKLNSDLAGQMIIDGDWIYYTYDYNKLFKMKTDGSKRTKILDGMGVITYLNIADGWLYFNSKGALYKMKTNGKTKIRLSKDNALYINVSEGWIYYSNYSSYTKKLYKIRTNGKDRTKLNDDKSTYVQVLGDWVYYNNATNNVLEIYKVKKDGTERQRVTQS